MGHSQIFILSLKQLVRIARGITKNLHWFLLSSCGHKGQSQSTHHRKHLRQSDTMGKSEPFRTLRPLGKECSKSKLLKQLLPRKCIDTVRPIYLNPKTLVISIIKKCLTNFLVEQVLFYGGSFRSVSMQILLLFLLLTLF